MFGIFTTLRGVQERNIFVDEHGRAIKLQNSWIIPPQKIERFVLVEKREDNVYWLRRALNIKSF